MDKRRRGRSINIFGVYIRRYNTYGSSVRRNWIYSLIYDKAISFYGGQISEKKRIKICGYNRQRTFVASFEKRNSTMHRGKLRRFKDKGNSNIKGWVGRNRF